MCVKEGRDQFLNTSCGTRSSPQHFWREGGLAIDPRSVYQEPTEEPQNTSAAFEKRRQASTFFETNGDDDDAVNLEPPHHLHWRRLCSRGLGIMSLGCIGAWY